MTVINIERVHDGWVVRSLIVDPGPEYPANEKFYHTVEAVLADLPRLMGKDDLFVDHFDEEDVPKGQKIKVEKYYPVKPWLTPEELN